MRALESRKKDSQPATLLLRPMVCVCVCVTV